MNLGTVRISEPTVRVVATSVDAPPMPTEQEDGARTGVDFGPIPTSLQATIEAENGTVTVESPSGSRWQVENIAAQLQAPGPDSANLHVEFKGRVADTSASDVRASADLHTDTATGKLQATTATISAEDFPLEILNPLLAWAGDASRLGGRLAGDARLAYDHASGSLSVESETSVDGLVVASPVLEPDTLRLARVRSKLTGEWAAGALEIDGADVACDLGELHGKGRLDLQRLSEPAGRSLEVTGVLDLPSLTRALPHWVRVREDVVIDQGKLSLAVRPSTASSGRIDARVEVSQIDAQCAGERVSWPKPVVVEATVGNDPQGETTVDAFTCESDFLRAKGSGSTSHFDVTAVCDLSRLQDRLGRLVDLGETRLAGRFTGRVQSSRTAEGGVSIRGAARADQLEVQVDGESLVAEPILNAQFQADSPTSDLWAVNSAAIVLKTDREHLNAHLQTPVSDWKAGPWGTWDVQASGDLAQLARRVRPYVTLLDGCELSGVGVVSGRVTPAAETATFEALTADIQDFVYASKETRIVDRRLRLAATGAVNMEEMAIALERSSLEAETVQVRADSLKARVTDEGVAMVCQADVAGDLAKLGAWMSPSAPPTLSGQFQGRAGIESNGRRLSARLDGVVNDARYGSPTEPMLDEPQVTVQGDAGADLVTGAAILREFKASVEGLAVTATGEIRDWSTTQQVQLQGVVDYDLARLGPRLRGLLGEGISMAGRDRRAFKVEGSLTGPPENVEFTASANEGRTATGRYPQLKGDFSFAWDEAMIFGFAASRAEIQAKLVDSWVVTQPIRFDLNGGQVEMRPGLFLGTQAAFLHHPAGMLANRVQVTQQMCDGALQYIAPFLAKTVDVKGSASLELSEIRAPLGNFDKTDFSGKLTLHDVTAQGGPLLQELLVLTENKPILEVARDSEVSFRVAGGRVYHENLRIRVPGATIITSGSVGFDRTLELMVETPLPKKWIPKDRIAEQLAGKTVKVPIGGTLDQPRLDKEELQRAIGRSVQESAGRVIEGEINKQIDKQLNRFLDKIR
jgi:hypothetical protein